MLDTAANIDYNIIQEVLLNEKAIFSSKVKDSLMLLRRQSIMQPVIGVGSGTCGTIAGALNTYKAICEYLAERNIKAKVIKTGCLGLCSMEPLVDIQLPGKNRLLLKNITENKVASVLDDVFHMIVPEDHTLGQFTDEHFDKWAGVPFIEELPFFAMQKRIVLSNCGKINPHDINEYIADGGYSAFVKTIRNYTSEQICDIIETSGLRGRSGGGFVTGKKWKIAWLTPSNQKYLICNAEESDPGAFMDRAITEGDPHRLLEGIAIASYAIGASKAYIYIRSEYYVAIRTLETAIQQAKELGLLGIDILNSGFNLDVSIKKCPGAFVCGEETALISSIEGKRGIPETKPPYPSVSGLFNKPTVINNVETLANIPVIIQNGPGWFSKIGTESSKGTKIFALSGKTQNTCLIEVPMGTTFKSIVFDIAGGIKEGKQFKALLVGGPVGYCFTDKNLDLPVDFDLLKDAGFALGSGGLVALDEDNCILDVLKFFTDFMQYQSCGKCIPCREGIKRIHEILTVITRKPVDQNNHAALLRFKGVMQLENLAEVMKLASLCGLGQSASNPILSALEQFRDEFEEHVFDRKCKATVCKELRTFRIVAEECTGCSICAKKCPVNAIVGTARMPYFIVDEKCTGCGICLEACKFNAVVV